MLSNQTGKLHGRTGESQANPEESWRTKLWFRLFLNTGKSKKWKMQESILPQATLVSLENLEVTWYFIEFVPFLIHSFKKIQFAHEKMD